jgi:hypothetical protein
MNPMFWSVALVAVVCVLSLGYYAVRGSKFPKSTGRVLYSESFVFGTSYRDILSKFLSVARGLVVMVTEDELWIRPFGMFYIMFLPTLSDLEHRIPKQNIVNITDAPHLLRQGVMVEFTDAKGRHHKIKLGLKNAAKFKTSLLEMSYGT